MIHQAARLSLAGGSFAYGLLGTMRPDRIAAITSDDEDQVRRMARRNLSSGVKLLAGGGLSHLLLRLSRDLRYALTMLRRKDRPAFAPGAIAFVILEIVAILTRGEKGPGSGDVRRAEPGVQLQSRG